MLRHNLAIGGPIAHATAIVAGWARYAEGSDEQGRPIDVVDRLAARVTAAARRYPEDPLALPSLRELFGDLAGDERFRKVYTEILTAMHEVGVAHTVDRLNRDPRGS